MSMVGQENGNVREANRQTAREMVEEAKRLEAEAQALAARALGLRMSAASIDGRHRPRRVGVRRG
jgi:hypothetical protein